MAVTMHVKSDSETSIDASSPPRSPRRPLYYVQSPSQHDVEKMSYGSSPFASPHHYHCSPIHHSRESSTSRFSASVKNPRNPPAWTKLSRINPDAGDDDDDEEEDRIDPDGSAKRFYIVCFLLSFVVLFTIFSLILLAASSPYKPKIVVKSIVFQEYIVQAGMDHSGVPTDMITLNSTVRIFFRNPATFFGMHVTSTPLELHYYGLKLATGYMDKFYQSRKSQRTLFTVVSSNQVPLYGGIPFLNGDKKHFETVSLPLNLTFVMRSRAYILGRLVKPKFYRRITCGILLKGREVGKRLNLASKCIYND